MEVRGRSDKSQKLLSSHFHFLSAVFVKNKREDLQYIADLISDGDYLPLIDPT